jgi:hypothetical protein
MRWSGRDTFTVEEAGCEILGLSRCSACEFARTAVIPTIRIGKRLIVPRVGLERLLTGMAGERNRNAKRKRPGGKRKARHPWSDSGRKKEE